MLNWKMLAVSIQTSKNAAMRKRIGVGLAGLLLLVLGTMFWGLLRERDPVYQGKRLTVWLEGSAPVVAPLPVVTRSLGMVPGSTLSTRASATPSAELEASADRALRHFGTNAIPTLLKMLRARDSALTLKLLDLVRKQHLIRIKHTDAAHLNTIACSALERLTELARSVVPALIEVYDRDLAILSRTSGHDSSAEVGVLEIPRILGKVGPEARSAIPSLLRGATNTVPNVRWIALAGLGEIHLEPEMVVPVLTQALQDPDPFVKSDAARALARFGKDAQPGIPALVKLLKDPNHWARDAGLRALGALHLKAEVSVPALVTALDSTNHLFAFDVALTLQAYGAAAKPAIPALIDYFEREENPNLHGTIIHVIDQIDPEAAAKAGIK